MVKEKKGICGPNCNQAKFYIVALVLVVAVVAIFSMYLGANLTGNPIMEKNTQNLKSPGDYCINNKDCQSGSCLNKYCTGLQVGSSCSGNDDCVVGSCSSIDGICGGLKARCYTDSDCINGCDENQRVCRGIKQLDQYCGDDSDCSGNLNCKGNAKGAKVCSY